MRARASVATGASDNIADDTVVLTVMVRFVGLDPRVAVDGLKVAVAPAGRPEAVKTIGRLKGAERGVAVKLKAVDVPGTMGAGAGEAGVRLKSP